MDGDWIAGGEEPTAADYMMIFPLEFMATTFPHFLGINTERYIRRVHERYVVWAQPSYWLGLTALRTGLHTRG